MKVLDLFAGIGGFRLGFENAGFDIAGFCEFDDYARTTYTSNFDTTGEIDLHDITKVTDDQWRSMHGKVDILTGGFPCFIAGTKITTNTGKKNIEDVNVGDNVLTHNDRYMCVTSTMYKQYTGTLYNIRTAFGIDFPGITPEHPFYVTRKLGCTNGGNGYTEPAWVNAEDIRHGDFIRISNSKERCLPVSTYVGPRHPDFWWCVGYYLANGRLRDDNTAVLNCNKHDSHYVLDKIKAWGGLGRRPRDGAHGHVSISREDFCAFVSSISDGNRGIRLPETFYNLPHPHMTALMDGYMFRNGGTSADGTIEFSTTSHQLALDLQLVLILTRNRMASVTQRGGGTAPYFRVRTRGCGTDRRNSYYDGNAVWVEVQAIKEEHTGGTTVYNISVDVDESYTANNFTVHNCQAFSVAGKRKGFRDTRGTLFFEILRAARIIKPRYLVLENVKGLLSHDSGETFETIITALWDLGYFPEWQICNSKNFGVPQHRERVFIVGHLGGEPRQKVFPIAGTGGEALKQLIGGSQGARVYATRGVSCTLSSGGGGMGAKTGLYAFDADGAAIGVIQRGRGHNKGGIPADATPALTSNSQEHNHALMAIIPGPDGTSKTVKPGGRSSYTKKHCADIVYDGVAIRRLTPLECFRLQGFPDAHYYNAKRVGMSDTQLYKQAGNAVSVPVAEAIAKRLKEIIKGGESCDDEYRGIENTETRETSEVGKT